MPDLLTARKNKNSNPVFNAGLLFLSHRFFLCPAKTIIAKSNKEKGAVSQCNDVITFQSFLLLDIFIVI